MRKSALALMLILSAAFSGCFAGPHQLKRTVDDWDHKMYVENPWVDAVLWIVPVFPFAHFVAGIGDFFVTDAYAFWFKDAFAGDGGTGFKHHMPEAKRTMGSLLGDGKLLMINDG